jgi:glutathione synthase/RimK-type ligase-like ATP-grasp enzyme
MTLHGESFPADIPSRAAQPRIGLNVLFGVPDDGKDVVHVSPDGRRLIAATNGVGRFTLRGSANIAPFLSERFALNRYYLQDDANVLAQIAPGPVLNHIADQDICSRALALVERLAERGRRPFFNHPRAVARTTRDGAARLLSGIPGLIVPKTIRVDRASPASVREAASAAGLVYPILVRVVGSHGGEDRLRIDRPDAMDDIARLPNKSRPFYLTEFCDFVSPDGHYRKYRIVVVGDGIFLRQCVVGANWSLHGRHRVEGAEQEEADLFQSFQTDWVPKLRPVFSEITHRLGLDYFGVDCHIDSSLNVLLFEANACMKILKNYRPPPNRFEAPIALIKTALENRLASPETWRYAPAGG